MKIDISKRLWCEQSINLESLKSINKIFLNNIDNKDLYVNSFEEVLLNILLKNVPNCDIININENVKILTKYIFNIKKFRILNQKFYTMNDFWLIYNLLDKLFIKFNENNLILNLIKESYNLQIKFVEENLKILNQDILIYNIILFLKIENFYNFKIFSNFDSLNDKISQYFKELLVKENLEYIDILYLNNINLDVINDDEKICEDLYNKLYKTINKKLNLNKYNNILLYFQVWLKILKNKKDLNNKITFYIKQYCRKVFKFFFINIEFCDLNILNKLLKEFIFYILSMDKLGIELNNIFTIIEENLKNIIKKEKFLKETKKWNNKLKENIKFFKQIAIKYILKINKKFQPDEEFEDPDDLLNDNKILFEKKYVLDLSNAMIEEFNLALSIKGILNKEEVVNPHISTNNNQEIECYIILEMIKLFWKYINNKNLNFIIFNNLTNKISIKNIGIQLNSNIKNKFKDFLEKLSKLLLYLLQDETNYKIKKNVLKELNNLILIDNIEILKIKNFWMNFIDNLSNNKEYVIDYFNFFVNKFKKIRYTYINLNKTDKINIIYNLFFNIFNKLTSKIVENHNFLNSEKYLNSLSIVLLFCGIDIINLSDENLILIREFYLYCTFFIYDINRIDNNFIYCNELLDNSVIKPNKLKQKFIENIKEIIPDIKNLNLLNISDSIIVYSIFKILDQKIIFIKNNSEINKFYFNNNIIYLCMNFLNFNNNFKLKWISTYETIEKIITFYINEYIKILKEKKDYYKVNSLASHDFCYLIYYFCSDIKNIKFKKFIRIYIESFPQIIFNNYVINSWDKTISHWYFFLNEKFSPIKNIINMELIKTTVKISYEKEEQMEIWSNICSIFLLLYINCSIFNKELTQQTINNYIYYNKKEVVNNKLFGIKFFSYITNICQNLLINSSNENKIVWFNTKEFKLSNLSDIIKKENSNINMLYKKFIKNNYINNNEEMLKFIKNIKNNLIQENNIFSGWTIQKSDYKKELISLKLNDFNKLCFYYNFFLFTYNYDNIKIKEKLDIINILDININKFDFINNKNKVISKIKYKIKNIFSILIIFCELSPNLSYYILNKIVSIYFKFKLNFWIKYIIKYFFNKLFVEKFCSYKFILNIIRILNLNIIKIIDSKYEDNTDKVQDNIFYNNTNSTNNDNNSLYIDDLKEIMGIDYNDSVYYLLIALKDDYFKKELFECKESLYLIVEYLNINLNYILINDVDIYLIYDVLINLIKFKCIKSYENVDLKLFVEINELIINFIEFFLNNDTKFNKLESLIKNYINFAINNWLKDIFFIEKHDTIISSKNMKIIKKIVIKLINARKKLKYLNFDNYLTKDCFNKKFNKYEISNCQYLLKYGFDYFFIKEEENEFLSKVNKDNISDNYKTIIILLTDTLIEYINSSNYFEFSNLEFTIILNNYNPFKITQMGRELFIYYIDILCLIDIRLGYLFKEKFKYYVFGKEVNLKYNMDEVIIQYKSRLINNEIFYKLYFNYLISKENGDFNDFFYLKFWKIPNIPILISIINHDFKPNSTSLDLFGKVLTNNLINLETNQVIFYISQLTQYLDSPFINDILKFFYLYSKKSILFSHQLIWLSNVESQLEEGENSAINIKKRDISKYLKNFILSGMDNKRKNIFLEIDHFFESLTSISSMMQPKFEKDKKLKIIKEAVSNIKVPNFAYMPTDPYKKIINIELNSGKPMQSAAKCPFLLTFKCVKFNGIDKYFEDDNLINNKIKISDLKSKFFYQNNSIDMDLIELNSDFNISKSNLKYNILNNHFNKVYRENLNINNTLKNVDETLRYYPNQSKIINESIKIESIKKQSNFTNNLGFDFNFNKKLLSLETKEDKNENVNNINFEKNNEEINHEYVSIIFKTKDDVRQDNLCLNIIRIIQEIFNKEKWDLYLFPYKTISNRTGKEQNIGGLIEVIPNSSSRDQIGKTNHYNLKKYFLEKFGSENSQIYDYARENFIKSLAAYSIVSYLLQIKDRHNGNILIDDYGHLIHIDFGFIFSISPGKNLGFEKADFKLTEEMIEVIGKNKNSEFFKYYMELIIKGFLAIRKHYDEILNLVIIAEKTGLQCFLKNALIKFKERFLMTRSDKECSEKIKEIIIKAINNFYTNVYDGIQYLQQKIEF